MTLEPITETIMHFIGLFRVETEDMRLRPAHEAFRAAPTQDDLPMPEPEPPEPLAAPLALPGFAPAISHPLLDIFLNGPGIPAVPAVLLPELGLALSDPPPPRETAPDAAPGTPQQAHVYWLIPLPMQMMTVTWQDLLLQDDDILSFGADVPFTAPDTLRADLAAHAQDAAALHLLPFPETIPDATEAAAFARLLDAAPASEMLQVNGAEAAEAPVFTDLLPAAITDRINPEDSSAAEDPARPGKTLAPAPFAVPPGHHLSTGGNLSSNETFIVSNGVDADVILVAGDQVRVDAISQVNLAATGADATAHNVARLTPALAEDAAPPLSGLPEHWQVLRLEGDLVFTNIVEQHVFATDFDRVEAAFTAQAAEIAFGDNLLANVTGIQALGISYDLVIVGGSMLVMNLIEQTNVLLDSDAVAGGAATTGGNLLMNSAEILHESLDTLAPMPEAFAADLTRLAAGGSEISETLARDALFGGQDLLSVLYIAGDLVEVNMVRQVNVLGDSDQIAVLHDAELARAIAQGMTIDTGANAMLNAARITDMGRDSTVLTAGETYSAALIHQAGLVEDAAPPQGVQLAALAPEAVAFLAPEMIEAPPPDAPEAADLAAPSDYYDGLHSLVA